MDLGFATLIGLIGVVIGLIGSHLSRSQKFGQLQGKTETWEVTIGNIEEQQSQLFDVIQELIEKVARNSQKLDKLLNGHFNDMRDNLKCTKDKLENIEDDVENLQGEFKELKERVTEIQEEE